MGFNCGIVGLPNVGKSTLFNALTQTAAAEATNYPFCTIEPNVGKIGVPDPRLFILAKIAKSAKIIPTQLEVIDIAGLVKGASRGEGLGNQFLGHIRSTDAILHIVRCFENDDIIHVKGSIDPIRDIETVETELIFADMESLEKKLSNSKKHNQESTDEKKIIEAAIFHLKEGKLLNQFQYRNDPLINSLHLITKKPILYVCNVNEKNVSCGNSYVKSVENLARSRGMSVVIVSAAIESEIALIQNETEKIEYIRSLGLSESSLARVIRGGYNLLNLITFFTVGPTEAHAWTTHQGAKAPSAAGVIHTDFERGFICAETISYEDYVLYNGENSAKTAGKMRLEGKDYYVKDGDIFHFRFNV
ncbi:MAG: redox-regulated ATPase YchF [Holosporaceae bacterium]|nr:redox-regulated ATPase YchF [Holosporaceae bacterium]